MAHEQSTRQGEHQQSTAMERSGEERGLATRQYQDPFSVFDSLFERMQRDFFGTSLLNALIPARTGDGESHPAARMPRVQMRDSGDTLELTAEMPGIDARNVSVMLQDDVLTISGEQRDEEGGGDERTERYVSFYRRIPLPDNVDSEGCQARYRDGVLRVRFPKTRARSGAREIPVTTEQTGPQQPPSPHESPKARAA
jgi:HSP20 family protein